MLDLLLKNGIIVDGSRKERFKGSLGIVGDEIAGIYKEGEEPESKETIDVKNSIIAPGFIDLHTHSDMCPFISDEKESTVFQGVTTELTGNCGITLFPANDKYRDGIKSFFSQTVEIKPEDENLVFDSMKDYKENFKSVEYPINTSVLIGHGTLRAAVMGFEGVKANDDHFKKMKDLLAEQMLDGAYGMSLGLVYPPSSYGDVEEFAAISETIAQNNGILTTHMRNEGDGVLKSINEMLEVAEKSGVHLHISHLKLMGKANWGKSEEVLNLIEEARDSGVKVTCDQYPYEASSTGLAVLVPSWAQDGGNTAMLKRLENPEDRLIQDIEAEMERRGGPKSVQISSTGGLYREIEGMYIDEIADKLNLSPVLSVIEILEKTKGEVAAIYYTMNMDDILNIMQDMNISVGSDGYNLPYDFHFNPHPRAYGTFPQFLQLVRENKLMSIEDAVYKITNLPAQIAGYEKRGLLQEGYKADITVFDFDKVKDEATYLEPKAKPTDINYVLVNGEVAVKGGELVNKSLGRLLLNNN